MRVLVTGGGTGIGLGIARCLLAKGHEVVLVGRREATLRERASEIGATWVAGDVTADPEPLFRAAGEVQGLVNNAGSYRHGTIGTWAPEDWDALYAVHVRGPAMLSQAFAERCSSDGAIVNIASTLALRPILGSAAYAAAKAALLSLTRSLALELAPRRIRVNAVVPGLVPTDMTLASRDGDDPATRLASLGEQHPLGRLGTPEDIASATAWLLLAAPWVTGTALTVDGGASLD